MSHLTPLPCRNETCLERNTSKVLVFRHNSTLAHGKALAAMDGMGHGDI